MHSAGLRSWLPTFRPAGDDLHWASVSLQNQEYPIPSPGFFEELRRRKVFRTAATYLAGAFVVLQVADLTFEPLGLSASLYRALVIVAAAGFPLALLLSWFFDLRAANTTESSGDVARATPRRTSTYAVAAVLVLLTGAFAFFAVTRYQHADGDDAAVIAVTPFQVLGGPQLAYLGNGIVEMVSRNIDGAAGLRAVQPEMVISAWSKKSHESATPAALAKQFGARYIVSGNIAQAGNQLRITASVQDFKRTDAKPVTQEVTGAADQLFGLVDKLSAKILAATRSGEDAHLAESAALTTNSLAALKAYLDGEQFYRKTNYDSAVVYFAQAVALDSTFALADYRLSFANLQSGKAVAAREPMMRALRNGTRLTARDQGMLNAYAQAFNGNWREAVTEFRGLLTQYPNDLELMYVLGEVLTISGPRNGQSIQEGKPFIMKVAAADPEFMCPI